ncbi:hypothetical protein [Thermomicrobium roseum]|uniref:hypothetical protein n=1 Tax=Thermomicrobium roseum TaxID=500 RepID=UPI00117BE998|nr:hypothetical protein [Thermomicrobium roseum]
MRRMEKVAQLSCQVRELWAVSSELVAAHRAALARFAQGEQAIAARRETVEAEGDQARALRETVRQQTEQLRATVEEHARPIAE